MDLRKLKTATAQWTKIRLDESLTAERQQHENEGHSRCLTDLLNVKPLRLHDLFYYLVLGMLKWLAKTFLLLQKMNCYF